MELVQIYFIKLDKHAVSVKFWSLQPHLLYYWLVASFTRQEYWSLQLHLNYSSTVLCSPIYSTGVLISVGLIYTRGVLIFAALFTLQKYWLVASFTLRLLHFCVCIPYSHWECCILNTGFGICSVAQNLSFQRAAVSDLLFKREWCEWFATSKSFENSFLDPDPPGSA